jgi:hypothetical protein
MTQQMGQLVTYLVQSAYYLGNIYRNYVYRQHNKYSVKVRYLLLIYVSAVQDHHQAVMQENTYSH